MTDLKTWNAWVEANRDICFDVLRIYLGIGLFVKGVYFISDTTRLAELLMRPGKLEFASTLLLHYIPLAHLGGGLLLAAGLMTRTAVLFQLPILFGAVFFVHLGEGLHSQGQNLEFTALVLFLLVLILFHGAGRLSVDSYLRRAHPLA